MVTAVGPARAVAGLVVKGAVVSGHHQIEVGHS